MDSHLTSVVTYNAARPSPLRSCNITFNLQRGSSGTVQYLVDRLQSSALVEKLAGTSSMFSFILWSDQGASNLHQTLSAGVPPGSKNALGMVNIKISSPKYFRTSACRALCSSSIR